MGKNFFKIRYEYAGCVTDMRTGKVILLYTSRISEEHCRIVTYQMQKPETKKVRFLLTLTIYRSDTGSWKLLSIHGGIRLSNLRKIPPSGLRRNVLHSSIPK